MMSFAPIYSRTPFLENGEVFMLNGQIFLHLLYQKGAMNTGMIGISNYSLATTYGVFGLRHQTRKIHL